MIATRRILLVLGACALVLFSSVDASKPESKTPASDKEVGASLKGASAASGKGAASSGDKPADGVPPEAVTEADPDNFLLDAYTNFKKNDQLSQKNVKGNPESSFRVPGFRVTQVTDNAITLKPMTKNKIYSLPELTAAKEVLDRAGGAESVDTVTVETRKQVSGFEYADHVGEWLETPTTDDGGIRKYIIKFDCTPDKKARCLIIEFKQRVPKLKVPPAAQNALASVSAVSEAAPAPKTDVNAKGGMAGAEGKSAGATGKGGKADADGKEEGPMSKGHRGGKPGRGPHGRKHQPLLEDNETPSDGNCPPCPCANKGRNHPKGGRGKSNGHPRGPHHGKGALKPTHRDGEADTMSEPDSE